MASVRLGTRRLPALKVLLSRCAQKPPQADWSGYHVVRLPIYRQSSSTTQKGSHSDEVERARKADLERQSTSSEAQQEPTIFSKILSKQIPADIIYEDTEVEEIFPELSYSF